MSELCETLCEVLCEMTRFYLLDRIHHSRLLRCAVNLIEGRRTDSRLLRLHFFRFDGGQGESDSNGNRKGDASCHGSLL